MTQADLLLSILQQGRNAGMKMKEVNRYWIAYHEAKEDTRMTSEERAAAMTNVVTLAEGVVRNLTLTKEDA